MVVETEDAVTYVHHATLEPVDGPAEATPHAEGTTAQGGATGRRRIDPVSGQVCHCARRAPRGGRRRRGWTTTTRRSSASTTSTGRAASRRGRARGFWEEADAAEPDEAEPDAAEDVGGGEAEDAKGTYEEARSTHGAAKARVVPSVLQAADGALGPARPDDARDARAAGRVAASCPRGSCSSATRRVLGDIIAELTSAAPLLRLRLAWCW